MGCTICVTYDLIRTYVCSYTYKGVPVVEGVTIDIAGSTLDAVAVILKIICVNGFYGLKPYNIHGWLQKFTFCDCDYGLL